MKRSERNTNKLIDIIVTVLMVAMAIFAIVVLGSGVYWLITGDNLSDPENTSETSITEEFPTYSLEEDIDIPVG